jgi:hypothetical protein
LGNGDFGLESLSFSSIEQAIRSRLGRSSFSAKIKPDSLWEVGMKKTALFKKYIFDPEIPLMPEAHGTDNAGISSFQSKGGQLEWFQKGKSN